MTLGPTAEAINVVLLKRLADAVRDGDRVRAVIRSAARNSDGWTPGIFSPSAEAQSSAILGAYSVAGISNISATGYLECHGIGTPAGDPIELSAVGAVFEQSRAGNQSLIIESVKSNLGDDEPAAGINGLMKAVMAVKMRVILGNATSIDLNPKSTSLSRCGSKRKKF